MTKVHEDLMTPPSSQLTASPTIVAVVSIVGVPTMTVLMNVLIWKTMGAEGRELQERITSYLLNVGVPAAITGVVGVVGRGLLLTSGKIKNQTPRDLPENAMVVGDVNVDASSQRPTETAPALIPVSTNPVDMEAAAQRARMETDSEVIDVSLPEPTEWGSEVDNEP